MKTFKTKQSKLIQIEKPLNIIWLKRFGYQGYTVFALKEDVKGIQFAHGLKDLQELSSECKKGSDIYMEEKKVELYNYNLEAVKDSINDFQKYNS
tara:strand:- start:210 stop:494 length:285 start_codon:yes stop_codon:yes gene_type:complete